MRAIGKLVAIAAALVLVAAAALYLLFDANKLRQPVQAQMEKALNRKVSLGPMRLRLFPLSVAIEQLTIDDDPAFAPQRPFLTAKQIAVGAGLMSLLRGEVKIETVRIDDPSIELIRSLEGKWNASTIGASGQATTGESKPLTLAELRVSNGTVAITDRQAQKERAEYSNIDLTLRDFAEGRPFQLDGAVRLPENLALTVKAKVQSGKTTIRIDSLEAALGGLAVTAAGSVTSGRLDLEVHSKNASIVEAARVAAAFGSAFAPDMRVTGAVNADLKINGTTERPEATGQVVASNLEMSRAAWKLPVRVPEIRIDIGPDSLKSNRFAAECGGTRLEGAVSITNYNNPDAFLAASISTGEAKLEELLHIAGGFGITAAAGMSGHGAVSLNARVMGKLKSKAPMGYSGSGYLRNATLEVPALSKPVRVANADLRFEQENAVLENLSLQVASTNLKGSAIVKRFSAPEVRFKADIDQVVAADLQGLTKPAPVAAKSTGPSPIAKITGGGTVNIGKILYGNVALTQVRAECTLDRGVIRLDPLTAELFGGRHTGSISIDSRTEATKVALQSKVDRVDANDLLSAATSIKRILYGVLAADANLAFVSKPGEDIARSLNGAFTLRMAEGKLTGVNLINELAAVAQVLGYARKAEPVTNIVKMTAALNIKDGVASTNDLHMDFAGGSLAASGVIGLADQSLKLKVMPVLSRQYSDQFGAGKVAGIMNTVLSNQNGELVIPVLVSGTLAQPRILPDGEQMAKMKLAGLVPTLTNPAAMASTIKGAIEEGRKGSVQGVIGVITGGAKKEEPAKEGEAAKKEQASPAEAGRKIGESLFDLLKKRK